MYLRYELILNWAEYREGHLFGGSWKVLTLNVDTSDFLLHGTGIYLAHIATLVAFPDLFDAQSERVHPLVGNTNSIIVTHDQVLQSQHRLVRRS